jgi:hypothetical protein
MRAALDACMQQGIPELDVVRKESRAGHLLAASIGTFYQQGWRRFRVSAFMNSLLSGLASGQVEPAQPLSPGGRHIWPLGVS